MAKQQVNYLIHHQEANHRLGEDDVSAIDISVYNALFLIWNECKWAEVLSINRQDVMKLAKVGNKNTYTASLKKLHEKGYITYEPSHNPLVGSLVSLTTFGKSGCTKSGNSSGTTTGNSSGNSSGTLYKHLETEKQLNTLTDQYSSAIAEVGRLTGELEKKDAEIIKLKSALEERKKDSAQKKKEDATPHWKALGDRWVAFYAEKHDGQKPTFWGKGGGESRAALVSIMQRLREHTANNPKTEKKDWTEDYALQVFTHFLKRAYAEKWRAANFRLLILSSHYDSIVNPNAKQSDSETGPDGVLNADHKRDLAERLAKATGQSGA